MMQPFFTIGHSTHPIEEFVRMLRANEVERVVDVRSFPGSRTNPQFNIETLPASLSSSGLGYAHMKALGGKRRKEATVPPEVNGFWENDGFHNYADYAMGEEFHSALKQLLVDAATERLAVMCAEAVWWRCHRRIIADYVLAAGRDVWHIMGVDAIEPARITPAARPGPNGALVYPD